jgi:hypothetical protein
MKKYLHFLGCSLLVGACVGEPEETVPTGPDPNAGDAVVLYKFDEGSGLIVHDRSGIEPAFDLDLDNLVTNKWVEGGGIEILGPSVITSLDVAEKVFVPCVTNNAVSLEIWAEPKDILQNSTLFSYSKQNGRNVTMYQNAGKYSSQIYQSTIDPMTMMPVGTIAGIQTFTAVAMPAAQHIVYTRDVNGAALYVNGADTKDPKAMPPPPPTGTPPPPPDLDVWSPAYQLVLGNESNGGKPFLGKIYMAAIYCKKLTPEEVSTHYAAGY